MRFLLRKLMDPRIRSRLLRERLNEPLHLNLMSLGIAALGSYEKKIEFDLIPRPQHAYGLYYAAKHAQFRKHPAVTVVEFGVGAGTGLMNLCEIAGRLQKLLGIEFRIFGFDSGEGLPPPRDYRDHPEIYSEGSYAMQRERLENALPDNAELVLGDVTETLPQFRERLSDLPPLGFVTLDLDYYWSTCEALSLLEADAGLLLPQFYVYVDDLDLESHNAWCGARLAIREFNEAHPMRKIELDEYLPNRRVFKRPRWLSHMFKLHVLDHAERNEIRRADPVRHQNPYL